MLIQPIPLKRSDLAELLYVERHSLGDSDLTIDEALAVLELPQHTCLGAYVGDHLIGFVSCFETWSSGGARLEVDMLGVLPDHRNRRYASGLIRSAVLAAHQHGARVARAVVRTDNPASLAAFRHAGFTISSETDMMIWDQPAMQVALIVRDIVALADKPYLEAAHVAMSETAVRALVLQVATLAYRGCWIEELHGGSPEEQATLATAIGQACVRDGLAEAGLLVPSAQDALRLALSFRGWQSTGRFYVLSCTL